MLAKSRTLDFLPLDTMTSGDTTTHPFVATAATEVEGRFSPDGKWVAYTSYQSGAPQVYLRPFPTGDARYQVSASGGEQPVWARDGRSLYYTGPLGGLLIRARLSLSPAFTVTSRDTLVRGGYNQPPRNGHAVYDVMPDGEHLLFVRQVASSSAPIVAVGWFDEMRAKLAREERK